MTRLVPQTQRRLNPDWVAEALDALREEGILEELRASDNSDIIVNFGGNHNGENAGHNNNGSGE